VYAEVTLKVTVRLSRASLAVSTTTRSQVCQGGARRVAEQGPWAEQFTATTPSSTPEEEEEEEVEPEAEPSLRTSGQDGPSPGSPCSVQFVTATDSEETNSGTNNLVDADKQSNQMYLYRTLQNTTQLIHKNKRTFLFTGLNLLLYIRTTHPRSKRHQVYWP